MPDINELELNEDSLGGEIDYDAPEPGSFAPQITPGIYDFRFRLEDDPYSTVEIEVEKGSGRKQKFLQLAFKAVYEDGVNGERELRFQRASFYKHPKMPNSMGSDLLRSLGIKITGKLTLEAVKEAFAEADRQGMPFRGEVGWRFYCQPCDATVSTNPRKKKGDTPWPRDADKKYVDLAQCPSCGAKGYGRPDIIRFKLPESASAPAAHVSTTAGVSV